MSDKIASKVAKILPRKVKFFAGVYLLTYSTTGKYSETVVPKITALETLDRFHKDLLK